MTFSFPTTSQDQVRASLEIYRRSQAAKLSRVFLFYLPILILVLGLMLTMLGINLPFVVLVIAIGMMVFWLASLILLPLSQRFQVYQFRKNTPSALGEQTFSFTEQGFSLSGSLSNTDLKWAAIHKIVETKKFFFFYINKKLAYFLPVVEVQKAGKLDDLREFLEACAPGRTQVQRR